MSYILEALKKAQAERQIGSTPTIHAPTLASAPAGQRARSNRTPVIVAMALMAAAIAGLATMLVRQQTAVNTPAAASSTVAVAPVAAAPVAPAPVAAAPVAATTATFAAPGAPDRAPAGADSAGVPVAATGAAPAVGAPASAAAMPAAAAPVAGDGNSPARQSTAQRVAAPSPSGLATAPTRTDGAPVAQRGASSPQASSQRSDDARAAQPAAAHAAEAPQLATTRQAGTAARGAETTQAPAAAAQPAALAPVEEQVQSLRELPEPIQRAIPQITLGGYMYSKNPADRLLLIDKVLRKEGEEVAPGLILDKLQPKQAIFSFRGYRYRVPL